MSHQDLRVLVEFSGGLELLFSNKRVHEISLPKTDESGHATRISNLINHLCKNVMKDKRREMFVLDGGVRPGVLVLINDADWELEGETSYELQHGDCILFVSTLHGG